MSTKLQVIVINFGFSHESIPFENKESEYPTVFFCDFDKNECGGSFWSNIEQPTGTKFFGFRQSILDSNNNHITDVSSISRII